MPYWLVVIYDGFANIVSGTLNGSVFLIESLGVKHDIATNIVTGAIILMLSAIVGAIGVRIRSGLRRGADAARRRFRREA